MRGAERFTFPPRFRCDQFAKRRLKPNPGSTMKMAGESMKAIVSVESTQPHETRCRRLRGMQTRTWCLASMRACFERLPIISMRHRPYHLFLVIEHIAPKFTARYLRRTAGNGIDGQPLGAGKVSRQLSGLNAAIAAFAGTYTGRDGPIRLNKHAESRKHPSRTKGARVGHNRNVQRALLKASQNVTSRLQAGLASQLRHARDG
jgi:hypothetical protein